MGYDLIPKRRKVDSKHVAIFTWPFILQETGTGYLFKCGTNTFHPSMYIYDGSRSDGSPVSNDGFEVSAGDALVMARLFRGYVFVKRGLREEWDKMSEKEQVLAESLRGEKAVPPAEDFLQKVEMLAEFCEQSGGFNIW